MIFFCFSKEREKEILRKEKKGEGGLEKFSGKSLNVI